MLIIPVLATDSATNPGRERGGMRVRHSREAACSHHGALSLFSKGLAFLPRPRPRLAFLSSFFVLLRLLPFFFLFFACLFVCLHSGSDFTVTDYHVPSLIHVLIEVLNF